MSDLSNSITLGLDELSHLSLGAEQIPLKFGSEQESVLLRLGLVRAAKIADDGATIDLELNILQSTTINTLILNIRHLMGGDRNLVTHPIENKIYSVILTPSLPPIVNLRYQGVYYPIAREILAGKTLDLNPKIIIGPLTRRLTGYQVEMVISEADIEDYTVISSGWNCIIL